MKFSITGALLSVSISEPDVHDRAEGFVAAASAFISFPDPELEESDEPDGRRAGVAFAKVMRASGAIEGDEGEAALAEAFDSLSNRPRRKMALRIPHHAKRRLGRGIDVPISIAQVAELGRYIGDRVVITFEVGSRMSA